VNARPALARIGACLLLTGCYHPPRELRPEAPAPAPEAPAANEESVVTQKSCDAALAAILARDPTLRAARAGLPVARADVDAAGGWDPLEIRVGDNLRDLGRESKVELRLRLPGPGVPGAESSAAEARVELTSAEIRALEVEVAEAARIAHADVRLAAERARLAQAAAAEAHQTADLLTQRARAGTATAVGETEARLAAIAADAAATAAERTAARLRHQWVSRAGAQPIENDTCAAPDPASAKLEANPAVAAARAEAWEADATAFAEARSQWIWPSYAQLGWAKDSSGNQRQDRIVFEFGIAIPWPGDDSGDVAAAEATHRREAADATVASARSAIQAATVQYAEAQAARADLAERQTEIDGATALLTRGQAAGAAPSELAGLSKRLREHQKALAEADHAVAVAAAELHAALGLAAAR
jgi:outer membrane protein TolC